VISGSYTKGSVKNGKNEVSLVARPAMKSLHVGTGYYPLQSVNYHDSRACGYNRSGILSGFVAFGCGMVLVLVLA
jgi:hypothetical protein